MLKRARLASPSPLHLDKSCIEYFDSKIARVIRVIRGSAIVPLSKALRGVKPQQMAAKMAQSKSGWYQDHTDNLGKRRLRDREPDRRQRNVRAFVSR